MAVLGKISSNQKTEMRKLNNSYDFNSKNGKLSVKIKESKKLFRLNDKVVREEENIDLN